ncbi:hypothetical protein ACLI08_04965 [Flavobacterium sp. RNTU_13]|uniref:hypothetical protein n=1 Tax=Flavobacterium sp. RNTU_13 TaxID=3375145 RepID=UPI00398772CF
MQKLIDDITCIMLQVENMKSSDYLEVYKMYKDVYVRYENLDESEFADYRFYNIHLRNISPKYSVIYDLDFEMLLSGHPDFINDGFPQVIISLIGLRDSVYSIATNQQ